MSRTAEVGILTTDVFPAFEDDGVTKRSGLTPADFSVTVYRESSEIPLPVSISEVGSSGTYAVEFTPTLDGFHEVEVLILFNSEYWHGEYEVYPAGHGLALEHIINQVDKIDIAPTLGTAAVTTGSLLDRLANRDVHKTYNQATDSLEGIRDRIS